MPASSAMTGVNIMKKAGLLPRWVVGAFLITFAVSTFSQEPISKDAVAWLQAMRDAMHNLDYQATVVYSRDNQIQTLKLSRTIQNGVVREHLQALNDPLREVVRDGDKVTCYFPDRRAMVVEYQQGKDSLFVHFPWEWQQKEEIYQFKSGHSGHVAGRQAQEIIIQPLDKYRYPRRIWLDTETKLPLKLELLDHDGGILEAIIVTDIQLGEAAAAVATALPNHSKTWKILDRKVTPIKDKHWQLSFLPPGFSEVMRTRRLDPIDQQPIDHILVSDGIASVSIYIKKSDEKGFDPGNKKLGAVNTYSKQIGDFYITVLGDVPPETVRAIANGVRVDTGSTSS